MGDLRAGQRQYQEGILLPLHFLALPSEAAWTTEWSQECGLLSSGNSIGVVFGQQPLWPAGNRAPVTCLTLPSSPAGWMVTESAAGKRTQDVEFPDENDSSTWGLWSRWVIKRFNPRTFLLGHFFFFKKVIVGSL